jgi:hypothetical protein
MRVKNLVTTNKMSKLVTVVLQIFFSFPLVCSCYYDCEQQK